MLRLPNAVASVAYEMQPKLHFLRTSHPRQRISHAMCSFLKCSLSCISYVHRIRPGGFLMRCASCSYSLITVTSSYRICTCFPFHRSQSFTKLLRHLITTYLILFNISYSYKIFNHFYTGVLFALRLIYSWRYGKLCTFQHQ